MTPAVGGAALLSLLGLLVARQLLDLATLRACSAEVGTYVQALASIYAVLAAFVVFVVWSQYNDARVHCDREANELVDLSRLFEGLPTPCRSHLQERLATYASAVIDDEWRAMGRDDEDTFETTGRLLDPLWTSLHTITLETDCHRTLHAEALSRFNNLADARTARLAAARARIPLALSLLLYFGGFSLVASMALLAIEELWIHAVTTASLAAAVSHLLYVVADLDDAFAGDWQISREPFLRAQRFIAQRRHSNDLPEGSATGAR